MGVRRIMDKVETTTCCIAVFLKDVYKRQQSEGWDIKLIKRIKGSLFAKVFILTVAVLLCVRDVYKRQKQRLRRQYRKQAKEAAKQGAAAAGKTATATDVYKRQL